VRSVTLDGDVYEPSGMMSGVLVRVQELCAAEERVADARRTLFKTSPRFPIFYFFYS